MKIYITRVIGVPKAYHVGTQIDTEDGDGAEGQRNVAEDEEQEGRDLGDVGRQSVGNRFLQVVENETAFLHTRHDRGKVIIQKDHVGSLFGDVRASDTHGDT